MPAQPESRDDTDAAARWIGALTVGHVFIGEDRRDGALKGLYQLDQVDEGAQACAMRPESAILLRPRARMGGATLALPAYFDNENSATRYLDLLPALSARVD